MVREIVSERFFSLRARRDKGHEGESVRKLCVGVSHLDKAQGDLSVRYNAFPVV